MKFKDKVLEFGFNMWNKWDCLLDRHHHINSITRPILPICYHCFKLTLEDVYDLSITRKFLDKVEKEYIESGNKYRKYRPDLIFEYIKHNKRKFKNDTRKVEKYYYYVIENYPEDEFDSFGGAEGVIKYNWKHLLKDMKIKVE